MLIRIGFDIELSVATPMALIYLLHVHPSRRDDLVAPENVTISGRLQAGEYLDSFGNHCGRINVPVGVPTVRLNSDTLIHDPGELDEVDVEARQHDPTELPFPTLQFLLPSRHCEVDSELPAIAWNRFGNVAPGWARVGAICAFVHNHLGFNCNTARPTRTALDAYREREGVCRDFPHLAITLCRCMNIPGALLHRLPRRHRRAARAWADGLQRMVRGLPRRPLVHLRRAPQPAPHRPRRHGAAATPATCRSPCASARTR
jgi:transglutaminase-like putative cysteine protease